MASPPVRPDNRHRRSDADALEGYFVKITAGPNSGRFGVYHKPATNNLAGDGFPQTVVVREARTDALLVCNYADVAPLGPNDRAGYG